MQSVRNFIVIVAWAIFAWPLSVWSAADPANPGILEIKDPSGYDRVVAISDAHAQYESTEDLLRAYGIIDESGTWAAGKTLFVVVGDSVNKGRETLELLDLWIRLQSEAKAAGGKLVHTLGNHEASLLARDKLFLRKHKELAADLKKHGLSLDQLLYRGGKRGRFLHGMPAGVRVGNVLFLHSGMVPDMSWAEFVKSAREDLRAGRYDSKLMLGRYSILNAVHWGHNSGKRNQVSERMRRMGLSTIVFGHDTVAFGEDGLSKVQGLELIEDGERPQMLVKIDSGMGKGKDISRGRLLFFDRPAQMQGDRPPLSARFSSRKMRKYKSLRPCEQFFVDLSN